MRSLLFYGFMNAANKLTFGGLIAALVGCFLALAGKPELGIICLIIAGISDLFDGHIARKLQLTAKERELGVQLDSIIDMANFGIAPVMIAFSLGLNSPIDYILLSLYGCCAGMRLAYFNVFTSNAEAAVKYYTGVPVTYAALVFPVVFACHGLLSTALAGTVIRIFFVLMSLLFVLRINVAKPQGRFYFVFVVLALMVGLYWLYRATC